ncbi:MAG: hypothetical protein JNL83_27120 [Myxococcales bacterium]|nr:hypothetical protein [Myxococcales bacterium]
MRAALLVLAVTAAPAHADREPPGSLQLTAVAPSATLALETAPCVRGLRARSSRVIGTARVTVVHDCEGDAEARSAGLAIRSADRWFFSSNGLVALERVSSNIIRRVTFAREHLSAGVLASGEPAAIYTIETINGTAGALRFGRVLVCTVRAEVACSEPLAFACAAESCTAPRLSRGVLIVHDADEGEQRYAVAMAVKER